MLSKLFVKNYALIDEITVDFEDGFNVITGETGSGKSILLGAMGLLLGQQADFSKLRFPDKKCICEGSFNIGNLNLESFFSENDIDFEPETIIRRELSPSGKSRAFINDSPVKLNTLRQLSLGLIDIHSQNDNSNIHKAEFIYSILDAFAEASSDREKFIGNFTKLRLLRKQLVELKSKEEQLKSDRDYYNFQLNELTEVDLDDIQLEELEAELSLLRNSDEIKSHLYEASELLSDSNESVLVKLKQSIDTLNRVMLEDSEFDELKTKVSSVALELEDCAFDVRRRYDQINPDEERVNQISGLVDQVNTLLLKHRSKNLSDLVEKRERFNELLNQADNFDKEIHQLEAQISSTNELLLSQSLELRKKRKNAIPELEHLINVGLEDLGMPGALFKVDIQHSKEFNEFGQDSITFLVKTNKGSDLSPLNQVASGGEVSRIMFLLKSALASKKQLATLILDEIDTGVSGEIASKLAGQIRTMGQRTQLIVVSHLAQIASKAQSHFRISKLEDGELTKTQIQKLETKKDIVSELANILSGDSVTEAALSNAESLLLEN